VRPLCRASILAYVEVMESKHISTRRALLKTGTAAVATLSVAPAALANTAPQLMRHASREIVLQFDVVPGRAVGVAASELTRA